MPVKRVCLCLATLFAGCTNPAAPISIQLDRPANDNTPLQYDTFQGDSAPEQSAALDGLCPPDPVTGVRDPECLAQVWRHIRDGADSDGDGVPDALDHIDGSDTDGDGIANADDPDVDGDSVLNATDNDVDGDGLFNDNDSDIDDDGLENSVDPDSDGDGVSDRFDLDDDADETPDDEDADEEEQPDNETDNLQNLVEKLRTGVITPAERGEIAKEISARLKDQSAKAEFEVAIQRIVNLGRQPGREAPQSVPRGISAVDAVYGHLVDALKAARGRDVDSTAPLPPEKLRLALQDFSLRVDATIRVASTFSSTSISYITRSVRTLRTQFSAGHLPILAAEIARRWDPNDLGDAAHERAELDKIVNSTVFLRAKFGHTTSTSDIFDAYDRLRSRADGAGETEEERTAKLNALLERMRVYSRLGDIHEALARVEAEDDNRNENSNANRNDNAGDNENDNASGNDNGSENGNDNQSTNENDNESSNANDNAP